MRLRARPGVLGGGGRCEAAGPPGTGMEVWDGDQPWGWGQASGDEVLHGAKRLLKDLQEPQAWG